MWVWAWRCKNGDGDVGMYVCFVNWFEVVVLLSVGVLLAAVDVDEARAVCWVSLFKGCRD